MARAMPPAALPEHLADIGALRSWVTWERVPVVNADGTPKLDADGKPRIGKVPRAATGRHSSLKCGPDCEGLGGITGTTAEYARGWVTYGPAWLAYSRVPGLAGVGFVFPPAGGFAGIDLDHVIAADGNVEPWAMEVVRHLGSYTEVSPSGTGLHVLTRGHLPAGARRRGQVEAYETGRYFTFTGRGFGEWGALPVRDVGDEVLASFHARWLADAAPPVARALPALPATGVARGDVVGEMFGSRHGPAIERLWRGDNSDHGGDASAGDLALCGHLAWWLGGDAAEVDRLFRSSGRMRPKWDELRGARTYGAMTVAKALVQPSGYRDVTAPGAALARPASNGIAAIPSPDAGWLPVPGTIVPDASEHGWSVTLPDEAAPGALGEVLRAVVPHTEADPAALLMTLLAACGVALGLRPRLEIGGTTHWARTHLLVVGRTAEGRKGESWGVVERAMYEALGEEWHGTVISGLSSGEGLVQAVDDGGEAPAEKRRLVVETEFARTMRVSRREANTLSSVLRQAWDGTSFGVLTRQARRATLVHLAVLGHITPEELRGEAEALDVQNGLLNRFLVCYSQRRGLKPSPRMDWPGVERAAEGLGRAIRAARENENPLHDRDPEADRLWCAIYEALNDPSAPIPATEARAAPMIARLSLLYAALEGGGLVRSHHLRAAVEVWWFSVQSSRKAYGERFGDPVADALLRHFRDLSSIEGSRPVQSQTDLHAVLGRNAVRGGVTTALRLLAEQGLLERVTREVDGQRRAGRPAVEWRLAEAGEAPPAREPRWLEVARG